MAGTITQTDQKFWYAYCDAVCTAAGFDTQTPGTNAIFFGTNAQQGPPAGDNIPPAFTNTGLYSIGDNLLHPDNLFYVPSASNSYIRSLLMYLGYVDLQGNPSPQQIGVLTQLFQNEQVAQKAVDTAADAAFTQFGKQVKMGLVSPTMSFPEWATLKAPAYQAAQQSFQSASAAYQAQMSIVYGPAAATLSADKARIIAAMYPIVAQAGLTMEACQSSAASANAVWQAVQGGGTPPPPTGTYFVPLYSSSQYKTTVADWVGYVNNDQVPYHKVEIKMSNGENHDAATYGQNVVKGSTSFSWAPWLSVNVSASSTEKTSSVISESEAHDCSVFMTYKDIKTADIQPGQWNIGDPKNTYKLKQGSPESVRTLVRPSRLVLGCMVGWEISVTDSIKSKIDTAVNSAKSIGGNLNVLGFNCTYGGASETSDRTTHTATWDNSGKTLKITPSADAGFATVLAIIGEKVQTF